MQGPIPEDQREELPSDWKRQLPATSDHTVSAWRMALQMYLAGHSCAECETATRIDGESLRSVLADMGLTRSMSDAQSVRHLRKRYHAKRLLEHPHPYRLNSIATLCEVAECTIYAWRDCWEAGIPINDWSARTASTL